MKILVTGGAGFIGSHLVGELLRLGHQVYAVDDLSTGKKENLAEWNGNPKLTAAYHDIRDRAFAQEIISEVEIVYHLAASVGVKLIVERLVESIENNIEGTRSVLEAAARQQKKVLLTSTSEVYGRGRGKSFSETDDLMMGPTLKSRWSYACSKALDEYLAFAYWREKGLPATVVRLFNTVGERQSDAYGMVVPTFVRQAILGKPLTIHGDGKQVRCFCHVSDVVRALIQLMEHPKSSGEVFNVGSRQAVTMNELARRVLKLTDSASLTVHIPYEQVYRPGFEDIQERVPDASKIQKFIGWQPTYSLDDIIVRMAAWYERMGVRSRALAPAVSSTR